ncbi:MAG: flagellar hook-associated protein FlgL [Planctomycetes bacterium]|nr:flagellar hook-associated protein FlgL [Planctomycetota bacterium]
MRVTTQSQYQQSLLNIQQTYAKVSTLQQQISSGKRLQLPSDGPTAMAQVLQNNLLDARFTNDMGMIQDASAKLQTGVDTLTQVQDLLTNVKNLALQANNVTTSSTANATLAKQVNTALAQLMDLANQTLPDGSRLYGGTASNAAPFSVTSTDATGQPTSIGYHGSQQNSVVIISQTVTATTLLSGQDVFQTRSRGTTSYTGTTGVAAGTGTDSATGDGTLTVNHLLTTYSGASGVAAGTSSPSGDTVIGPSGANSLVINDTSGTGASGTVSLNGGPAISFTNLDTDLKVTGPNGEVVYLNTTAIAPGFSGNVPMTATGTVSTDGNATSVPIDFSGNQVVLNGTTGAMTNIDSTNIRQAGTAQVHYQGTSDLFQSLIVLRDTIANTQGLSAADRSAALNQQIGDLDRASSSIGNVIGSQSVQAQSLASLKDHLTSLQLNLSQSTDNLQATDTASAVVDLQKQMNLYQASLQIAAQINSLTLINFLK